MIRILSVLVFALFSQAFLLGQLSSSKRITDEFEVKMINDLSVSPSGDKVVFAAVGKVYLMSLKDGKPKQLTKGQNEYEFEPSFSADGKKVIYASWNESGYGKIHIVDLKSKWKQTALITAGIYRTPRLSEDGRHITYKKEIEVAKVDTSNQKTEGLYVHNLAEGDPIKINGYGDEPQYNKEGDRIVLQSGTYRFGSFVKTFESIDLRGANKETLFYGKYGHEYSISPDFKWVAWQELGKIYVVPFPAQPVGISADNENIEPKQVSNLPGNNLSWSDGGKTLSWMIADKLFSLDVDNAQKPKITEIDLTYKADIPRGVLAFTNARIITMEGNEVIEHGTVIVKGNKIIEMGFDIQVPKEAHAINCSGKTILPGLIDLDPASNNYDYNLSPIQEWEYIELLRAGVTTKLDGGFKIANGFANKELIASGKLVGPRLLSGGVTIAEQDEDLFSDESYKHYTNSNLLIASSFGVTAVQSSFELEGDNFLQLENMQNDTSLVTGNKIHDTILSKSKTVADNLTLLHKYTSHNAKLVGLSNDLGSIKVGKVADIIIVDGNPLDDITNLSKVTHTVINGRVYECATMEEVGNYRKRISRNTNSAIYESLNRAMGSACCGFQH